jgi:hypothetical protein
MMSCGGGDDDSFRRNYKARFSHLPLVELAHTFDRGEIVGPIAWIVENQPAPARSPPLAEAQSFARAAFSGSLETS